MLVTVLSCHNMIILRFLCFNKTIHKIIVGILIINVSINATEKKPYASLPIVVPQYSAFIVIQTATIVKNAIVNTAVNIISNTLVVRFIARIFSSPGGFARIHIQI